MNTSPYAPPYAITTEIFRLVADICETVARFTATSDIILTPRLRRENRIRSIRDSLAIEQNSLSLVQFTGADQVGDHVTDQVKSFLRILSAGDLTVSDAMKKLSLVHRPSFRSNYVHPALKMGLVEMTQPDAPRSPTQRYRLTQKGRNLFEELGR